MRWPSRAAPQGRPYSPTETALQGPAPPTDLSRSPVILNRGAVKNPVNRTKSVTIRDPSLILRMTMLSATVKNNIKTAPGASF